MQTLTPSGNAAGLLDDLPRLHKIGTYTLVVLSMISLWAGNAFSSFIAIPCLILAAASWFWESPRVEPDRFNTFWTAVTVAFIALCVYLVAMTETPFVTTGVYFVLYLSVAKLFQRARLIDYAQLLALSFLLIASSTAFNEDVNFGLFFGLYTVIGVVTFAVHHLRSELEENTARGGRHVRQLFGASYAGLLVAMSGIVFFVSIAFFFLFPRLGFGFFAQKTRSGAQQSGFSEKVELGGHGNIKSDNTVVMRVQFPNGKAPARGSSLYWRGTSFDQYDGKRWNRSIKGRSVRPPQSDWNYFISDPPSWVTERTPIEEHSIYLEPIGSDLVFAMTPLLSIGFAEKDKGLTARLRNRSILLDPNGDIRYKRRNQVGYQYTTKSILSTPPEKLLETVGRIQDLPFSGPNAKGLKPKVLAKYTQLPPTIDPRIKTLAEQLTKNSKNDYERAIAIANHLSTFKYTTNLPDPGDESPLAAFLFTHKAGHCEYFSTAMTIMLRSVGVPTRNVNGFLGGKWNDFDGYLAVRNADAHSWLEIYFGEHGWVRFDPTPPDASILAQKSSWYEPISQFYDSLKFKWFKYVIEYNLETQIDLLKNASEALGAPKDTISENNAKYTLQQVWLALRGNGLPVFLIFLFTTIPPIPLRIRPLSTVDRWDILAVTASTTASLASVLILWKPAPTAAPILASIIAPSLTHAFALLRRVRPSLSSRRNRTTGIVRIYTNLQTLLHPHLDVSPQTLGPQALLTHIQNSQLPAQDPIRDIIHTYMHTRFGGADLSSTQERTLNNHLKSIRKALREHLKQTKQK